MPAGGGFDRAFDMLLTFDLAKIEVLIRKSRFGPIIGGTDRFQGNLASQKLDAFRERTCPVSFDLDGFEGVADVNLSMGCSGG